MKEMTQSDLDQQTESLQENKEDIDARSIFVGNVDYGASPEEITTASCQHISTLYFFLLLLFKSHPLGWPENLSSKLRVFKRTRKILMRVAFSSATLTTALRRRRSRLIHIHLVLFSSSSVQISPFGLAREFVQQDGNPVDGRECLPRSQLEGQFIIAETILSTLADIEVTGRSQVTFKLRPRKTLSFKTRAWATRLGSANST
jgi:hypothetical protein